MNLLLANQIGSLVLLGVLLIFLVASPFIMRAKNKKEMDNAQKMMDAIKKGDTVLTATGVIGKVISIGTKEGYKTVTLETGDEHHKGYITLDIGAVYTNLSNPIVEEPQKEEKVEETTVIEEKVEESAVVEQVVEPKQEKESKVEQPKQAKKATTKSSSKKTTKNQKSKK